MNVTVYNCARCGGCHDSLTFFAFQRPVDDYTHWAPCPVTKEPILLQIRPLPTNETPR